MSKLESPRPESDTLSLGSKDSFDWIGDSREEISSDAEDYYQALPLDAINEETPAQEGGRRVVLFQSKPYKRIATYMTLITLATLSSKWSGLGSPRICRLQLYIWACYSSLKIFMPIWISHVLDGIDKFLNIHPRISKTSIPAMFLAIRMPVILMSFALLYAPVWYIVFPFHCPPDHHFCPFGAILRMFIFVFATGLVLAVVSVLMIFLRNHFQRKSFQDKVTASRFKMHILKELCLLAEREKKVRKHEDSATTRSVLTTTDSSMISVLDPILFSYPQMLIEMVMNLVLPSVNQFKGGDLRGRETKIAKTMKSPPSNTPWKTPKSTKEAKGLAQMIFKNLAARGERELVLDDFLAIIPNKETANEAYSLFDADQDGSITKMEFRAAVLRIVQEHHNLLQSLANAGSVLSVLDKFSYGLVAVILTLLLLVLVGVNVGALMGVVASFALSLNFIISDAANKTFHSLLMLFVVHPYDVGDRLVMSQNVGFSPENILTVIAINIQNTVFRHWNGDHVTVPNHILALTPLTNLSRNTEQWERLELALHLDDDPAIHTQGRIDQINTLRDKIEGFLLDNPRDFYSSFEMPVLNPADTGQNEHQLQTTRVVLNIRCKETQNTRKKLDRHLLLLSFLQKAIAGLNGVSLLTES